MAAYTAVVDPAATSVVSDPASHARLVTVRISGGVIAWHAQGEGWGAATKIDPGSAMFDPDAGKTDVRRMRNEGTADYHAILVQLLR